MSPSHPQLHLLIPWELPTQGSLSDDHRVQLSEALNQLLRSLKQPSSESITTLDQALARLNESEVISAEIASTKTPLRLWQMEDFDQYFGVTRVQTPDSATCLVMNILLTCRTFLFLVHQDHDFSQAQIEQQKNGFASYARLLARVFNLCI